MPPDHEARYYALADDVLDAVIERLRKYGEYGYDDPLTTAEIADIVRQAIAGLDPDNREPERREKLLTRVLATAIQRLVHTEAGEP